MSDTESAPVTDSCDRWDEAASLLAAGCLEPAAEPPLRRHLAACPRCAARFADLARLCLSLEAAVADPRPHVAAIRARSSGAVKLAPAPRPRDHRVVRATTWLVATAASAAVLWLTAQRLTAQRPAAPPPLRSPQRGAAETAVSPAPARPSLLIASELAAADSDASFDAILQRHAASTEFASSEPVNLSRAFAKEFSR